MSTPFSHLAEVYDAMIDWTARLSHEAPFYRWLLARAAASGVSKDVGSGASKQPRGGAGSEFPAHAAEGENFWAEHASSPDSSGEVQSGLGLLRLLDAACGTGRHAEMFHRWGLQVEAADVSAEMIEYARRRLGEPAGLRWVLRGFEEPVESDQPFDLAICVGNSLSLAPNLQTAQQAIERLLDALRPGGFLLIHVLNLGRLPDGTTVWQKCQRSRLTSGEALIIKGVRRCGQRGAVELLVVGLPQAELLHAESATLLGLTAEWLQSAAQRAGASAVELYGGYDRQPYHPQQSVDLLMVAAK